MVTDATRTAVHRIMDTDDAVEAAAWLYRQVVDMCEKRDARWGQFPVQVGITSYDEDQ